VDAELVDRLHWLAIPILAGLGVGGFFKLCSIQARRPARRDGDGRLVTPGLVMFAPMLACGVFALGFLYYLVFVGIAESRPDYNGQMFSLVAMIVGFGFGSIFFLYIIMGRIRWDGAGVLRTLPGLKPKFIAWTDLISVEVKNSGDVVLRGAGRKKITFSKFMPGALELLEECQTQLANKTRPSTTSRTAGVT
jgi:hypothetical protein